MKKVTKRIMAGIFALAMVLTMLPQVTAKAAVDNEATVDMTELQIGQGGGWLIYDQNDEYMVNRQTLLSGAEIYVSLWIKDSTDLQHNLELAHFQITSSNSNVFNVDNGETQLVSSGEDTTDIQQAIYFWGQVSGNVGDTTTLTVSYNGTTIYQEILTVSEVIAGIPTAKLQYNGMGLTLDANRFYSEEEIFSLLKNDLIYYEDGIQKDVLLLPEFSLPKSGYYLSMYMKDRGSVGRYIIDGVTYDWDYADMGKSAAWDQFWEDHDLLTRDESTYSYMDGILSTEAGSGQMIVYVDFYVKRNDGFTTICRGAEVTIPVTFVENHTITATGDSNVTISGSADYLPDGAKFDIAVIKKGSIFDTVKNLIKKAIASVKNWAVYEMNLKDANGAEIHQLDGYVQVVMPIPEGLSVSDKQTLCVYRVDGDQMIACETTVKDGKIYFNTNHFSTYVVAEVPTAAVDTTQQATSPKTGENMLLFFGLGAAALALVVGTMVVAKKRALR